MWSCCLLLRSRHVLPAARAQKHLLHRSPRRHHHLPDGEMAAAAAGAIAAMRACDADAHVLPWLACVPQTSYILAVNSGILSDTGGTCTDADCTVRWPRCCLRHVLLLPSAAAAGGCSLHPAASPPGLCRSSQGPKKGQPGCRFTDPGFQACVVSRCAPTLLLRQQLLRYRMRGPVCSPPACARTPDASPAPANVQTRVRAARGAAQPYQRHGGHVADGLLPDGRCGQPAAGSGTRHG